MTLCRNLLKVTHHPSLASHVQKVSDSFTTAFDLFSKCHKGYNSNAVDEKDIEVLGRQVLHTLHYPTLIALCLLSSTDHDIVKFLQYYRATFPKATFLPKMHILEDHVIPWLKRWRIGAGMMGAESIHAHLMRVERNHQGIANSVEQLKYIFKQHMLETTPSLVALRPPPTKRKLTKPQ